MNLTNAPETKFVPVTVMLNSASPTVLLDGEMLDKVGNGLPIGLTVNAWAFEVPPPGAGLSTVILNVPMVVKSLAGMVAVSSVALTKVVARFESLSLTLDSGTKFAPLTVIVNSASPTVLFDGEMLAVVGAGLFTVKA